MNINEELYDIGDQIQLKVTLRNSSGTLTNGTVSIQVKEPDGTITSPSVSNSSTGLYSAGFTIDQSGEHLFKWTVVGALTLVEEGHFYVRVSALT